MLIRLGKSGESIEIITEANRIADPSRYLRIKYFLDAESLDRREMF